MKKGSIFKLLTIVSIMICFDNAPLMAMSKTNESDDSAVKINQMPSLSDDENTKKIFQRANLYDEGRVLEKKGLYVEAIEKYAAAKDPELLNYWHDAGMARNAIMNVRIKQGMFESALKELQWFIQNNPNQKGWIDQRRELEAFIKTKIEKSESPTYAHIKYLETKYSTKLPPQRYVYGFTSIVTTTIIRIYDYMGAMQEGIDFIDKILAYQKLTERSHKEYLNIRVAFEKDKAERFKGCLDSPPGEVCMGRATKALIQSDYFPW